MKFNELPGYDTATELGFTLQSYSGSKPNGIIQQATYVKEDIFFVATNHETQGSIARFEAVAGGIVHIKTVEFSIPHPRIELFEERLTIAARSAKVAIEGMRK